MASLHLKNTKEEKLASLYHNFFNTIHFTQTSFDLVLEEITENLELNRLLSYCNAI